MMKSILTPFFSTSAESEEVTLAGSDSKKTLWKKEILPSGKRKYGSDELDFSKITDEVIKTFSDEGMSTVPFVFALPDNLHPETGQELTQLEGHLTKLEKGPSGELYGYFDLSGSEKAQKAIDKMGGDLPVSCKIDVNYTRGDTGKTYGYALKHVCATTAPHIKGMGAWEKVELSEPIVGDDTLDLSDEDIDINNDNAKEGIELADISKEDLDLILGFIKDTKEAEEAAAKLVNADNDKSPTEEDTPSELATVGLTEEAKAAIELSEKKAQAALALAEKMQADAAEQAWQARRDKLSSEGVPPAVLDLAEPVLKLHRKATITLSDTESVDASQVISSILEEMRGTVRLSDERGHSLTESADGKQSKEEMEFFKAWGFDFGEDSPKSSV